MDQTIKTDKIHKNQIKTTPKITTAPTFFSGSAQEPLLVKPQPAPSKYEGSQLFSRLPNRIKDFVVDNDIKLINPYDRFASGADMVFHFLHRGATGTEIVCAYRNAQHDSRFSQELVDKLLSALSSVVDIMPNGERWIPYYIDSCEPQQEASNCPTMS